MIFEYGVVDLYGPRTQADGGRKDLIVRTDGRTRSDQTNGWTGGRLMGHVVCVPGRDTYESLCTNVFLA